LDQVLFWYEVLHELNGISFITMFLNIHSGTDKKHFFAESSKKMFDDFCVTR